MTPWMPPLKALSRPEKERTQWLSEDLYSISEPPETVTSKVMSSQAQQQLNEAIEARQVREWVRALTLLREFQEYISPALVSYLRGSIWLEAGIPDIAAEFFKHAWEFDPTNANYGAIYFYALSEADSKAAAVLAGEVLVDPEKTRPRYGGSGGRHPL